MWKWWLKTTLQISSPIALFVLIILAFLPIETNIKGALEMWLPIIIFFATFTATGLVLLFYFGTTGKMEAPESDYGKLKSILKAIEAKIDNHEKKHKTIETDIESLKKEIATFLKAEKKDGDK